MSETGNLLELSEGITTMNNSQDPFYLFKDELVSKFATIESSITAYHSIVNNTNTATNNDWKASKKQLKKILKSAEDTLKDLQTTVRLVENDRAQFQHIDDAEFESRKNFVGELSNKLLEVKSSTNNSNIKNKLIEDEKKHTASQYGNMGASTAYEKENTDFVVDNHANAQMMMRQQDETLEDLDSAVDRVGMMAENINVELGVQNKMLDELETDLDEAEEKMGLVMGKLGKLLKTKNGCQLWTIVSLCLVLVFLFALVLYT